MRRASWHAPAPLRRFRRRLPRGWPRARRPEAALRRCCYHHHHRRRRSLLLHCLGTRRRRRFFGPKPAGRSRRKSREGRTGASRRERGLAASRRDTARARPSETLLGRPASSKPGATVGRGRGGGEDGDYEEPRGEGKGFRVSRGMVCSVAAWLVGGGTTVRTMKTTRLVKEKHRPHCVGWRVGGSTTGGNRNKHKRYQTRGKKNTPP